MDDAEQETGLRILSQELKYDKKLTLTNNGADGGLKKMIIDSLTLPDLGNVEDYFAQLNREDYYPNNYVFAALACRVYEEKRNIYQNDNLYGRQLDETLGNWQLLTVAYNDSIANGYVGAAYWNPDMHQIIIAHRGTVFFSSSVFGILLTDLKGICLNQHTSQINSAITFTDKIISALKEINQNCRLEGKKEPCIQLFFTGHSLGGWLAQITTFTAKYLVRAGDNFVKSGNFEESGFHANTVVFDSPGCRSMLERIQDRLVNRYSASLIRSLDITSYLSAPNLINACNPHVGVLFRIFFILSEEEKHRMRHSFAGYTRLMHKIEKFKEVFDPETGTVRRDEEGNSGIGEVKDWPLLISGDEEGPIKNKIAWGVNQIKGSLLPGWLVTINEAVFSFVKWHKEFFQELNAFFTLADEFNDYHLTDESASVEVGDESYRSVRYLVEELDQRYESKHSVNVFTQFELQFLETYKLLSDHHKTLPDECKSRNILTFMEKKETLKIKTEKLLECFTIKNDVIHSKHLHELIPHVKRMLHFFPEINGEVGRAQQDLPIHTLKEFCQTASSSYVTSFEQALDFENDTLQLGDFLENEDLKILHTTQTSTSLGAIRVYKTFKKVERNAYRNEEDHIFLSLGRISYLGDALFIGFLKKIQNNYLMVIERDDVLPDKKADEIIFRLFKVLEQKPNIKIILITGKGDDLIISVTNNISDNCLESFYRRIDDNDIKFNDFSPDSKIELLKKLVIFQGKQIDLCQLLGEGHLDTIIDSETIIGLLSNKKIEIGKALPGLGSIDNFYINRKLVKKLKVKREIFDVDDLQNDLFVVSDSTNNEISKIVDKDMGDSEDAYLDSIHIVKKRLITVEDGKIFNVKMFETLYNKKYANQQCNLHWLKIEASGDLIWKISSGESLSGLRRYIEAYERDLKVDEYTGLNTTIDIVDVDDIEKFGEKFIIIAAEPGMGKSTALTRLGTQKLDNKWMFRLNLVEHKDKLEEFDFSEVGNIVDFLYEVSFTPNTLTKNLLTSRLNHSGGIVLLLDGFDEITSDGQKNIIKLLKTLQGSQVEKVFISTRLHFRDELEDCLLTFAYTFKPFFKKDQEQFLKKFWKMDIDPVTYNDCIDKYINDLLQFISESIGDKERTFMGIPLQMRMFAEAFQEGLKHSLLSIQCYNQNPFFPESFGIIELYDRFIDVKYQIYFEKIGGGKINLNSEGRKDLLTARVTELHRRLAFEEFLNMVRGIKFFEILIRTLNTLMPHKPLSEATKQELSLIGIVQFKKGVNVFIHRTFAEYFAADFLINILIKKYTQEYKIIVELLAKELFEIEHEVTKTFLDYRLAKKEKTLTAALKGNSNDIESSVNFEAVDDLNRTALHYAAQEGSVHIVNILLKKKVNAEDIDALGKTALHYAARYNRGEEVVSFLLKNSTVCINMKDKNGCTPVYYAAQQGNWDIVDRILTEKGASLDGLDTEKLLFHYTHKGNLQDITKIIKQTSGKVDVSRVKDNLGNTLLHIAAQKGRGKLVRFLVEEKTDVNVTNKRGETPIHYAIENGHRDVVGVLIEYRANLHDLSQEHQRSLKNLYPTSGLHTSKGIPWKSV